MRGARCVILTGRRVNLTGDGAIRPGAVAVTRRLQPTATLGWNGQVSQRVRRQSTGLAPPNAAEKLFQQRGHGGGVPLIAAQVLADES